MNIDWDEVWCLILAVAVGTAIVFAATAVVMTARSSGAPDYCLPVATAADSVTSYKLVAHRPWKPDWTVAVFPTFTEASAASERLGCPFRAAP